MNFQHCHLFVLSTKTYSVMLLPVSLFFCITGLFHFSTSVMVRQVHHHLVTAMLEGFLEKTISDGCDRIF